MRYIDDSPAKTEAARAWQSAFKRCIVKRLRAHQLRRVFMELSERHKARPRDIADVLLRFRAANGRTDDVLLFNYAEMLVKENYFTSADLLGALLRHSNYSTGSSPTSKTGAFPICETRIFNILTQHYMTSALPKSPLDLMELVHIVIRWMRVVSEDALGKQVQGIQPDNHIENGVYEALGSLAISVLGNSTIRGVMKQKWWRQRRGTIVTEMDNYDSHVLQWMQSQLCGRLHGLTGILPFLEIDAKGFPVFTDEQILSHVPEVEVVHSRAGIFIWLNAALTARPLTDDMTVLSILQGRYPNDSQNLIIDLLVGSFDALTNALLSKELRQDVKCFRSFICNKIPLLLSMLSGTIQPPVTCETCIQMALIPGGLISMDPLAPITAGANDTRDYLKTTRLDFLQACFLHGLVSEGTIHSILQETVVIPRVAKLNKDTLVLQCANNLSKLSDLIEELGAMQGNAGAAAGCIVETISNLCMNKDTMSLKSVCDKMIRHIPHVDFLMQCAQPGLLLLPLCNILNDWVHDQDQTEFTPAYEEFASILLFTLAIIHRYDLDFTEIGIVSNSFVARLLDEMTLSKPSQELSPDQNSQLSKWIEGLFAVDEHGETSGIGDEVMRQCSPQAFYALVPTLFEQSILGCRSNVLQLKTFKGGLELLLEPFLLPSLIMGLGWLAGHSWEDHNDAGILLQVLEKLLKPSSNSQETQIMHRAVIAIVATPLFHSLQEFLKKQSSNKRAKELLEILRPHVDQHQRSLKCKKETLDQVTQNGGLQSRVQADIRELTTWASTSTNPPNPPPRYSHRLFALACQTEDHEVLLKAIIKETNATGMLNMPVALDVVTSLICAPAPVPMGAQQGSDSSSPTARLRNSVRLVSSNVQDLLHMPESEGHTIVRIGRRVEANLAYAAQMPAVAMPLQIPEQAADQMLKDLGMNLDDGAGGTNMDTTMDQTVLSGTYGGGKMSGLDPPLDLANIGNATEEDLAKIAAADATAMNADDSRLFAELMASNNNEQSDPPVDLNQEEDIFAGLDMGMGDMGDLGDDFNFN